MPRFSTVAGVASVGLLVLAIAAAPMRGHCCGSPIDMMKVHVDKIAGDWYSRWSLRTGRECPAHIVEVAYMVGASFEDVLDVWGEPLRFVCKPGRFDVYSLGPDREVGGGDDIKSWERQRRR